MTTSQTFALAWRILRAKYEYYVIYEPVMTDYEYDLLERKYEQACAQHGWEPHATNMVGYSFRHPYSQAIDAREGPPVGDFKILHDRIAKRDPE